MDNGYSCDFYSITWNFALISKIVYGSATLKTFSPNGEENKKGGQMIKRARLTANAKVATVLGSISAFSDAIESEGWQKKLC